MAGPLYMQETGGSGQSFDRDEHESGPIFVSEHGIMLRTILVWGAVWSVQVGAGSPTQWCCWESTLMSQCEICGSQCAHQTLSIWSWELLKKSAWLIVHGQMRVIICAFTYSRVFIFHNSFLPVMRTLWCDCKALGTRWRHRKCAHGIDADRRGCKQTSSLTHYWCRQNPHRACGPGGG